MTLNFFNHFDPSLVFNFIWAVWNDFDPFSIYKKIVKASLFIEIQSYMILFE